MMASTSTMANSLRLSYDRDGAPAMYTQPTYNGAGEVKRRRGRPRKYTPDVSHSPVQAADFVTPPKRPRGRPPGSLNKQQTPALGSPGVGFTPHILDVKDGEDLLAKMMWFSQNSNRALCILSANGAVSNVTLRQSTESGGTVTYEGNFEILSFSGSFMVSEVDGRRRRTGGISVSLSGPDGRVLGGNVAGLLTAASPVQLIVGSFVPASQKQTSVRVAGNNEAEVVNGPYSESSGGGLGSPFDHNNSNPQSMANMSWR